MGRGARGLAVGLYVLLVLPTTWCGCGREATAPNAGLSDEAKRGVIEEMYLEYRKSFPEGREMTAGEVAELQGVADVVIVDVREDEERRVAAIPGSVSRREFRRRFDEFRDSMIVVQCTVGYRSGEYAESLVAEGLDARNLKGGILSWAHAGLPLVDEAGRETKRVHVYGKDWDLLPAGFEAVW